MSIGNVCFLLKNIILNALTFFLLFTAGVQAQSPTANADCREFIRHSEEIFTRSSSPLESRILSSWKQVCVDGPRHVAGDDVWLKFYKAGSDSDRFRTDDVLVDKKLGKNSRTKMLVSLKASAASFEEIDAELEKQAKALGSTVSGKLADWECRMTPADKLVCRHIIEIESFNEGEPSIKTEWYRLMAREAQGTP